MVEADGKMVAALSASEADRLKIILWSPDPERTTSWARGKVPAAGLRDAVFKVRTFGRVPHRRTEIICKSEASRDRVLETLKRGREGKLRANVVAAREWRVRVQARANATVGTSGASAS